MDGHVGDMTFRDKSIFTNSFHDFTKQPSVIDDLGTNYGQIMLFKPNIHLDLDLQIGEIKKILI